MSSGSSNSSSNSTLNPQIRSQSSYNRRTVVDGAIMGSAVVGGFSLAKQSPNLIGRVGLVLGGVGLGAARATNISGNISKDIGDN